MFEIISLVLFVLLVLSIAMIVNLKKQLAFAWHVADYFREDNHLDFDILREDINGIEEDIRWIRQQFYRLD